MTAIGIQLYSLHAVGDQLPTVLERVGGTRFEGVEFAGIGDASVEAVSDALDRSGLEAAAAHVGLEEIEADPEPVAETARRLGYEDVVVPWLDPEHFESTEAVEAAAVRLSAAADDLAARGLSLHYHNHDQEFRELDGEPALAHLADAGEGVGLELDVGWAGAAGYDPLALLDEYADRLGLVHLKDYDAGTGDVVEVGEGDLDVDAIVAATREHGVDWLIYEAEERPDSYETLSHADEVVAAHW
ncbi:sugar phosphate isomerase/epimerase [Halorarum halophilum]|uniref:Sugar phosphate isomerase/epimerase n=1 Tax=Halorarum halophilum TaxID=2743090 RepID=A0A7D5GMT9_9EURY|nr:sugar phosphate isomerase/epimerase [Halobaculum halophilum]QLG29007.1 sugar phosphate isomerase/epimerase [Halobaculum halophilum]